MNARTSRRTIRIAEPEAFGDVTLAPASMTGRSESQQARAMAKAVDAPRNTAAQTLKHLRTLHPDSPLSLRVAALHALMRR